MYPVAVYGFVILLSGIFILILHLISWLHFLLLLSPFHFLSFFFFFFAIVIDKNNVPFLCTISLFTFTLPRR